MQKKKYFLRCVGINSVDESVDVRISGIYELENIDNIILDELKQKLLKELKAINKNVAICDITNMNNID